MEGDTMGGLEVPLLYFLTCVLVTWMCSVCENSPNCVLMIHELFYMYVIHQLKVRNISIKRTQIRKIHQGLIHHTNFSQPKKIHRKAENNRETSETPSMTAYHHYSMRKKDIPRNNCLSCEQLWAFHVFHWSTSCDFDNIIHCCPIPHPRSETGLKAVYIPIYINTSLKLSK